MELSCIELRGQICDVCHEMWQFGWVTANDGNVPTRLDDGIFLATSAGTSRNFITPKKLVRINGKGEVLEGPPRYGPSSEIKMHLRCYKERGDANSVLHAYPLVVVGYAVANVPLDEYSTIETVIALGSIPVASYGTPSTCEVPDNVTPYLREHDVMFLQNHGALIVGADMITAYYRMEALELFAKINLNARMLGDAQKISRGNIDRLISVRRRYGVTGRYPDYKKCSEQEENRR